MASPLQSLQDFSFAVSADVPTPVMMEFSDGLHQIPKHIVAFAGGPEEILGQAEVLKEMAYHEFLSAAEGARSESQINVGFSRQAMLQENRRQEGK